MHLKYNGKSDFFLFLLLFVLFRRKWMSSVFVGSEESLNEWGWRVIEGSCAVRVAITGNSFSVDHCARDRIRACLFTGTTLVLYLFLSSFFHRLFVARSQTDSAVASHSLAHSTPPGEPYCVISSRSEQFVLVGFYCRESRRRDESGEGEREKRQKEEERGDHAKWRYL